MNLKHRVSLHYTITEGYKWKDGVSAKWKLF